MQPERNRLRVLWKSDAFGAYYYARTRTGVQITEHISGDERRAECRTRTGVLPRIGRHNGGCGFYVGEGIVDPPGGGAQPFHADTDRPPLGLVSLSLPARHGFLHVCGARIGAAKVQPRITHRRAFYAASARR